MNRSPGWMNAAPDATGLQSVGSPDSSSRLHASGLSLGGCGFRPPAHTPLAQPPLLHWSSETQALRAPWKSRSKAMAAKPALAKSLARLIMSPRHEVNPCCRMITSAPPAGATLGMLIQNLMGVLGALAGGMTMKMSA